LFLCKNPLVENKGSIRDILAGSDWESLAEVLRKLDYGVKGQSAEAMKLRAQLGLVKILMHGELSRWNGDGAIDLTYLMASYKCIKRLEGEAEKAGVRRSEFRLFLKLIRDKFMGQKIRAKKRMAMLGELERMKEVVENGNSIV